jgi:uncharacterized sulfatase
MTRPSFVLIMTDTQGANIIGTYGHPELETPNIDRLAETSIKFTRAYTTCPLCTPARAGLFTGIYSHTSGPWTNNLPLGDNIQTMGQRLQDDGYRTAFVGKWHLDGHDYFGTGICPPGWEDEYWYDGKRYLDELTEDEITLWRSGLGSLEKLQENDVRPEFTWAHRVSDRAIRFLKDQSEDPFVLVVSYDEPRTRAIPSVRVQTTHSTTNPRTRKSGPHQPTAACTTAACAIQCTLAATALSTARSVA